jgi:DNA-binding NarL/FixJ family response regulator
VDSLIEKSSLLQVPSESFMAQAYAQGDNEMANGHGAFAITEPAMLSMVQTYKLPAANAPDAGFLTPREMEVLERFGTGLSVKGAARGLSISPGTVKWHVKNIYYKLGASSREDALAKARLRNIIR